MSPRWKARTTSWSASPPRVVPFASKAGLRAQFSIDLETGHDLLQFATRSQVVTLVQDRDGFATKTPSLLS